MFSHLPLRHQYAFLGIGGLFLLAMFGIGGHYLRQPAPMTLVPLPESRPVADDEEPAKGKATTEVIVHVVGAVKSPTVVHMHPGNRVHDAIRLAGGATANADLEGVNLAARLEDGTQLYIPRKDEPDFPAEERPYGGGSKAPSRYSTRSRKKGKEAKSSGPVNLNTGSLDEFDTLPGIGPSTAQKILDYRRAHGGFSSINELLTIPGFGSARLEKIRSCLRL